MTLCPLKKEIWFWYQHPIKSLVLVLNNSKACCRSQRCKQSKSSTRWEPPYFLGVKFMTAVVQEKRQEVDGVVKVMIRGDILAREQLGLCSFPCSLSHLCAAGWQRIKEEPGRLELPASPEPPPTSVCGGPGYSNTTHQITHHRVASKLYSHFNCCRILCSIILLASMRTLAISSHRSHWQARIDHLQD